MPGLNTDEHCLESLDAAHGTRTQWRPGGGAGGGGSLGEKIAALQAPYDGGAMSNLPHLQASPHARAGGVDADGVVVDPAAGTVVAEGSLRIQSPQYQGTAERLDMNVRDRTGTLQRASLCHLQSGLYLPTKAPASFHRLWYAVADDFSRRPDRTEFVPVIIKEKEESAETLARRDQMLIEQADLLMPISVRQSGNMAEYLYQAERQRRPIERRFQIPCVETGEVMKLTPNGQQLGSEILGLGNQYIVHWTRATSTA